MRHVHRNHLAAPACQAGLPTRRHWAAAASLAINASGAVTTTTTALLTPGEVDEAVKKSVPYRAPGQ
jgi:hypothetical protein